MTIKRIKLIIIVFGIIGFVLFLIHEYYVQKKVYENFLEIEYSGIIDSIHYYDGNHGFPVVKLNGKWHRFGVRESWIESYIKVGDSISKEVGSDSIFIFRLKSYGIWHKKGFKTKK